MGLDFGVIRLVAVKELRESLRDRRTLFVALLLPVLIYPIVLLGFGPLVGRQKAALATAEQAVAVTGADAPALKRLLFETTDPEVKPLTLRLAETKDPAGDLQARRIALWIDAPEGFDEALANGGSGEVRVSYDGSDDQSREARTKFSIAFDAAASRALAARMKQAGLAESWRRPLVQDVVDVAPPDRSAAYFYGKVLALLLVLMTLTSSFYPAVDAVAGEKERGTMETLLVAPCGRTELVLGKFLAVCAVTLVAALLNLASLAFSTGPGLSSLGGSQVPALSVTAPVVFGILCLLVPLAALFSAVALSLSTLARSIKEAQHYLSPLVMLVMPLAMAVILPNLPLTTTLAAVPVTNAVLFFRDLLLGRTEFATTVIVFATTFGAAGLAIWASVLLFLREETLFRGPEGTGGLILRPEPRERPTASSAAFLFAGALAILWYAQPFLPVRLATNVVVTQFGVVLAPALVLAWWLRVSPAATFRLRLPMPAIIAVGLCVPLGIALPGVVSELSRHVVGELKPDGMFAELERRLSETIRATPSLQLVLLVGVLPALCEELFFRGFLLSGFDAGFRGRGRAVRAILVSAVCFALFHIFPEKWFTTFVIGVTLAWIAVRTGSIWPGVVAHAMNNASVVLTAKAHEAKDPLWLNALHDPADPSHTKAVAAAAAVTVSCLAFLWAATRKSASPAESDSPGRTAG